MKALSESTRDQTVEPPSRLRAIFGKAVVPSPQQVSQGLLLLKEGGDLGFIARYVSDPSVVVEAAFNWDPGIKVLMQTPLLSVIIWRGRKTIFEFFNGATLTMPSREDASQFVLPLVQAFHDYRPIAFARDTLR